MGGYFLSEDVSLFDAAFFNLSGDVASVSPIPLKAVPNRRPRLTRLRPWTPKSDSCSRLFTKQQKTVSSGSLFSSRANIKYRRH